MLTAILATCGTSPTSRLIKRRRAFMRGGAVRCQSSREGSRAATADLELFALVLHALGGVENLDSKFAVRLANDFHGVLILHDVAGRGVDRDFAARTIARPTLHRIDDLLAVGNFAIELFDRIEDGVHGVPTGGGHEIRVRVFAVCLVPGLVELLV